MTSLTSPDYIDLNGDWSLSPANGGEACPIQLPGDIHSALLTAGKIPDPYYGFNEDEVKWVGDTDWSVSRSFTIDKDLLASTAIELEAEVLDTCCEVFINGKFVGRGDNRFRLHRWDVRPLLVEGNNTIQLQFKAAPAEMVKRAAKLPYHVPHVVHGQKIPNWNLLRKPMCHAGWDWGILLQVAGSYGRLGLKASKATRLDHVWTTVELKGNKAEVKVTAEVFAWKDSTAKLQATLGTEKKESSHAVVAGVNHLETRFVVENPKLWWPNGMGAQEMYPLEVQVGSEIVKKKIGLRSLEVKTAQDAIGRAMTFSVNGVDFFAKGANWIPSDALPSRQTAETERGLLTSAAKANMNMIRVWGGGQFESDAFYEICDELGILIWHDLMFSCSLYPTNTEFLDEVSRENEYQAKRLRDHPSIALWCGDNECVGALTWFVESQKNRDRYLLDWDRLNRVRSEAVAKGDAGRVYWPSSPCAGPGDFSDTFHSDGHGDMHYWMVWHEGRSFDAYYNVKPRFCSEFGYQSFPSLATVKTFCPPEDFNITSPTMEFHQRNNAGNRLINEMFSRYFRMPAGFEQTLYLSQVQQATAIKTAVEFWRTLRPNCMGTIYWQLNDVWPVASWASLEYGGRWKQLHHHARRFFSPVIASVIQKDGEVALWIDSDLPLAIDLQVSVELWDFEGKRLNQEVLKISHAAASAAQIQKWKLDAIPSAAGRKLSDLFLHVQVSGTSGGKTFNHENTHFFVEPKRCSFAKAQIKSTLKGKELTLETDKPAFFVFAEKDNSAGEFDDNSITLLPGKSRVLTFEGEKPPANVGLWHLAQSY